MSICSLCGSNVPSQNITLHQMRCSSLSRCRSKSVAHLAAAGEPQAKVVLVPRTRALSKPARIYRNATAPSDQVHTIFPQCRRKAEKLAVKAQAASGEEGDCENAQTPPPKKEQEVVLRGTRRFQEMPMWKSKFDSKTQKWFYEDRSNAVSSWKKPAGVTFDLPTQPPQVACDSVGTASMHSGSVEAKGMGDVQDSSSPECAICFDGYDCDEDRMFLPCCHCFHTKCAASWVSLKKSCPTCRYPTHDVERC